jgi:imidazolonepropionase-like amidohydrolase
VAEAVLLIEDERIVAIGTRGEIPVPEEAARIGVADRWTIPGLIAAHVHFFQSGGLYTRPDVVDLRSIRPYAEELARTGTSRSLRSHASWPRRRASPWPGRCLPPSRRPR